MPLKAEISSTVVCVLKAMGGKYILVLNQTGGNGKKGERVALFSLFFVQLKLKPLSPCSLTGPGNRPDHGGMNAPRRGKGTGRNFLTTAGCGWTMLPSGTQAGKLGGQVEPKALLPWLLFFTSSLFP